ncbi:hemicentin-1-like [Rhopilema esculentum]|uniref:hemicentin-1-like n=1 Tax=Rhopilema esculentum TaxID=499914 RepID=UPI0031D26716
MVFKGVLILLFLAIHLKEFETVKHKSKLQANKTYTGVPGRSLSLKWNYKGQMYRYASIYIADTSASSSRGSQNYKKLWQVTFPLNNDTVTIQKSDVPSSVFNNLTELVVVKKLEFHLKIRTVPRGMLKFEFMCRVKEDSVWAPIEEKTITVMVAVPPVVTITVEKGNNIHVPKGTDINVVCSATGYPVPKIEIEKDSKRLAKAVFPNNEVTLELKNFQPANAGRYVCSARNIAGATTQDTLITITYIELRESAPLQIFSSLGSSQALQCPIDGYPPVIYSWFKGYKQLGGYRESRIKLDRHENFGNYSCVGQNDAGSKEVTFSIWMEEPKAGKHSTNDCYVLRPSMTSLAVSMLIVLLCNKWFR